MERIITSIRQLLEELEEEIQMVKKEQTESLFRFIDIRSTNNQDEIKQHINELIREIADFKEKKSDRIKDVNMKEQKDDGNNTL